MDYIVTLSNELDAEVQRELAAAIVTEPTLTAAVLVQRYAVEHWAQKRRATVEAGFARVMSRVPALLLQLIELTPAQQDAIQVVVQAEINKLPPPTP